MIRALALLLVLASCAPVDACKYAELRRTVLTAAIRAAQAYEMTGRAVPYEVDVARNGAIVLLASLDTRCPRTI